MVLSKLYKLPLLQVLKLRKVHLRDEDLTILAEALDVRLRSLDLRGNHLTDHSIRTLLCHCFMPSNATSGSPRYGRSHSPLGLAHEDWPIGLPRPDLAVLDEFQDESYDDRLVRRLTRHVVSRLPFEDLPHSGLTQLRISNNSLSIEGLASLIRSKRLCVLDAGSISVSGVVNRKRSDSGSTPEHLDVQHLELPGVEKLVPILERCGEVLTSLRIDHSIVTEVAPSKEEVDVSSAICELDIKAPAPKMGAAGSHVAELDDTQPPIYELDSRTSQPTYELASPDSAPGYELEGELPLIRPSALNNNIQTPEIQTPEIEIPEIKRGEAYAPEVLEGPSVGRDDEQPVLSATGLSPLAQGVNGIRSNQIADITSPTPVSNGDVRLSIALIEKQRRELRLAQSKTARGLTPNTLPKLRALTLTEVPCYERTRKIVNALIQFIKDCAAEAELADLQARLESPPTPKTRQIRGSTYKHSAREIFPLQKIILEMAPDDPISASSSLPPHLVKPSRYTNRTRSSTEDADSEAFWTAQENDFTFFDDDEECGLPLAETSSHHVPYAALAEKMVMPAAASANAQPGYLPTLQRPKRKEHLIDVVQELAKFRRERKAVYENAVRRGVRHVDGYWPGEVKIVRGHGEGEMADYYGNFFAGAVYR